MVGQVATSKRNLLKFASVAGATFAAIGRTVRACRQIQEQIQEQDG